MTDRGVSVVVNYVLGLGIATLLIGGLLVGTGAVLEDRQESAARSELRVIGERVSASVAMADRLAQTDGAVSIELESPAPSRVAGQTYTIRLNATSEEVVLETVDESVTVRVPFVNTTTVASSSATGGDVEIVLNAADELEVRAA